ncbi:MAG: AAA family ATPase [Nanoarchaeota archaeon]|nr:AAA family ATPase [Nanoarchaeota archaeon]
MSRLIVIEGIDGSGKDTVAKKLVEKVNGNYFFTPPEGYKMIRGYINNKASPEARFLYYLSSVIDVSSKINKSPSKNDPVCVRYVWSTMVYYSVMENKSLYSVSAMVKPFIPYIVQPDINVLLTVSEEEQIRRLKFRNGTEHTISDLLSIEDDNFRKRINEAYQNIAKESSWVKIDTTNKSIDEIVDKIIKKYKFGGQK